MSMSPSLKFLGRIPVENLSAAMTLVSLDSPSRVKSCPDGPEVQLPLYPRKRTQVGHRAMSEKCQQRKSALHELPKEKPPEGGFSYQTYDRGSGGHQCWL